MTKYVTVSLLLAAVLAIALQAPARGQAPASPSDLGTRVRQRYDIVALQQGVALVPRQTGSSIRMIQIVDGVVTIDGNTMTGQQLRERLGQDADLVLQVSYLDAQRQRELAGAPAVPAPAPDVAVRSEDIERTDVRRGDIFRFGDDVSIAKDERVQGDVVVFGGSVTIDGEVTGDVFSFGGPMTLGPAGIVRGDVTVLGGGLTREPGSRIYGDINEVGRGGAGRRMRHGWRLNDMLGSFASRLGSLAATVFRIALLALLGIVALAFARTPIERIAARTAVSPVRAGLVGLLAEILFLPVVVLTVVVLAISIVGIPLLVLVPFAIVLLIVVMLVGYLGLAYQIGGRVLNRLGWTARGAYTAVATGVIVIAGVTVIAKLAALAGGALLGGPLMVVGYLVEYVAWTIGFGATILAWYETQTRFGRTASVPSTPAT